MIHENDSIAFFITWTVYGTYLQGDRRGWKRRRDDVQPSQPRLSAWHKKRLKHDVQLLTQAQRLAVEQECERHCRHRGWRLWEVSARTNHVHCVVSAPDQLGNTVRDQLKAICTRALRERWPLFCERPVWTVGGDWRRVRDDADLESVCRYVREFQTNVER